MYGVSMVAMARFSSHGVTDLLASACLEIGEGYL